MSADVMAYIDGDGSGDDAGVTAGSISITANDESTIDATVGAISPGASFAGVAAVTVSVGIALAHNEIDNDVAAYIANADDDVTTNGSAITISATEKADIDALTVAASLGAAVAGVAGIAVSGAGALALNVILTDTNAYVADSDLSGVGAVDVDARNTSSIDATVAAGSAAVAGGTVGVGVSVGAAVARNLIGFTLAGTRDANEVQAYIQGSEITATGAVTLDAFSNQTINAEVLAGSAAIAAGAVGVGVSGAGVVTRNRIAVDAGAYIDGQRTSKITADSLSLAAIDQSTIDATAGSASVAATFGAVGVSVAVGLTIASNEIDNNVQAYIAGANDVTTTTGGISVTADETAMITSEAFAASAAGSLSLGGSAAAAITTAENVLTSEVTAYISDSGTVTSAGGVEVAAVDISTISADILSIALSGGLVSLAVGVILSENTMSNNVTAYLQNSNITAGGDNNISVTATSIPAITTDSTVGAVSFGFGGSAPAAVRRRWSTERRRPMSPAEA